MVSLKITALCFTVALIQLIPAQTILGPGVNYCINNGNPSSYDAQPDGTTPNINPSYNGNVYNNGQLYNGLNNAGLSSYGGSFNVISSSSLVPSGISVLGENLAIDGPISVAGSLPFASTVTLEGNVPANGEANVEYGCGTATALNNAGPGVGLSNTGANFGIPGQQNIAGIAANANRLGRFSKV